MKRFRNITKDKIRVVIIKHIDKFLNTIGESVVDIEVSDQHFGFKSYRFGGKCEIKYFDKNRKLKTKVIWVKETEQPKKFFDEMSLIYKSLSKYGLHLNTTKPYWYDLDSRIVFISYFSGQNLLGKTFKYCLSFSHLSSKRLPQLYYYLGKWLHQYHEVVASTETISLHDIIAALYYALYKDKYFNAMEKRRLTTHLNNIQNKHPNNPVFSLIKSHNDFTSRNIIVSDSFFGIVDWDSMIHFDFPRLAPIWNDVSYFLLNLQSLLRIYPLISKRKIKILKQSFLRGYFDKKSTDTFKHFNDYFYIFSLRYFLGIDIDRTLPQIYNHHFASIYINMLKKGLLSGSTDLTCNC